MWYLDGHHQTFADRSHPIPSIFKRFSGYNTPELAKHRKRSHVNMNADVLKKHASSLKSFLLSPWMKKDCWAVMKTAIEELTATIEFYVYELAEKNRAVKKHSGTLEVASDELSFRVLEVTNDSPVVLKSLTEALQSKQVYEPIFIRDFAPVDRRDRYTYVRLLERGLPVKCVLCTKSFGASIGNYQYIWKIPMHVTLECALRENQRIVADINSHLPKYHTQCMRREFISKFGLISPETKPYTLRQIYKELTGEMGMGSCVHTLHVV